MPSSSRGAQSRIFVLAGTNGAGKSSVAGALIRDRHSDYFNPDEAARKLLSQQPGLSQAEANSAAWHLGKRLLGKAISERLDFTFETTLGGNTIPALLQEAATSGIDVIVWYVGLNSPELHIARVRSRVQRGGHDIPEELIRERYAQSQVNLIRLMPALSELSVFDNSAEADPHRGIAPVPLLVLRMKDGMILETCDLSTAPKWTKAILAAAMKLSGGQ